MKKNVQQIIKYIFTYLYLISGYSIIIYNVSYYVRLACKPMGWALMIAIALMCFICYSVANHIFLKKILSHKLLIIIEAFLFVAMFTLIISDLRYEAYVYP